MNNSDENLVVVYQMGKVASTSIVNAVKKHGFNAVQSHFMGSGPFKEMIDALLAPHCEDFFFHHQRDQLFYNIDLMRSIINKRNKGEKIRMISLARRPDNWYWANILQNIDGYLPFFKRYAQSIQKNDRELSDYDCIDFFYKNMLSCAQQYPIHFGTYPDTQYKLQQLKEELKGTQYENCIPHFGIIDQPLSWFDKFLRNVFEIDIYNFPLSDGYCQIDENGIELLVLDFEKLPKLHDKIGSFLGISNFELNKDNFSNQKEQYQQMKSIQDKYNSILFASLEINSNRYCQHFGYQIC